VSVDELESQEVRVERSTAVGHPPVTGNSSRRGFREWKRPPLFAVLPIALVAGAYAYATGGRIVSIDDAYVDPDKVGVSGP
jgi:membrane fusion protein (multidrug efflux system)